MPTVFLPDNSVINVTYFGRLFNQQIITLFQYQLIGASDHAVQYDKYFDDIDTECQVAGDMDAKFLAVMPGNYVCDTRRIQAVYPQRIRFKDYLIAENGGWVDAASTANIAASIERYGLTGGRRSVGRVQIPVPDGVYTNGEISSFAYQSALVALGNQFVTGLSPTPVFAPTGLYNSVIHNTANPVPLTTQVTGTTVHLIVRTMHRRTVGLGI